MLGGRAVCLAAASWGFNAEDAEQRRIGTGACGAAALPRVTWWCWPCPLQEVSDRDGRRADPAAGTRAAYPARHDVRGAPCLVGGPDEHLRAVPTRGAAARDRAGWRSA